MVQRCLILPAFLLLAAIAHTQGSRADTAVIPVISTDAAIVDTSIDYDELFRDFDEFMDSILSPRSYFLISLSTGKGFYNFENKSNYDVVTSKKLTYSPTLGYYHKSGLGITANGYFVDDGAKMNFFQSAITPSYDYLKNKNFATGISYTKFITKDSLPFYTTPIQNELYTYFIYRKWWFRPMVAMSYGWGSRSDYEEREVLLQDLRLRRRGYTYINTQATVRDFSLMASVRHDFYWLDVFTYRDHIRFTPQLTFTSGTQKFGFNQSSTTYATGIRSTSNVLYYTDNFYLDDELKFQPLSLTLFLRSEYTLGRFFIQPQVAFDYFFPASSKPFNTLFSINAGFMF
ncbi:MAG: hypothetical protein FJY20_12365 [Bacteroidetes bacterium]|nr:hypothetical protein [Bacteroidota bacterium]